MIVAPDICAVARQFEISGEFLHAERYGSGHINDTYRAFFKNCAVLPARTTVESVLWNGIKVEIDCVARKPA